MPLSVADYFFYPLQVLGVILICATFVYEDEEGRIQSKIENVWIRLDDTQLASRSRVAAFMQEVARLTGQGFDVLFGKSLLSLRFAVISIYLSFASFFLFVFLAFDLARNPGTTTRQGAFALFLFFLTLALVPAVWNGGGFWDRLVRWLWWAVIPVTLLSISGFIAFVYKRRGAASTFRGIGFILLPFTASLLADLSYIAVTRWILRLIHRIDHILEIGLMVAGNLLLLAIPLLGPIYIGLLISKYEPRVGAFILISVLLNSIDVIAGSAALVLALILLLHRLFWPVIGRPLYAIQRYAPIKNKKWLFGTGVALILLPRHITFQVLKALLEKLS